MSVRRFVGSWVFLVAAGCGAAGDSAADSGEPADTAAPDDTADTGDTSETGDPCAEEACCYEPVGAVHACTGFPAFPAGETAGRFTTAETRGEQTVWTFLADDETAYELMVSGEGLALGYLNHLDELGSVRVSVTGGCGWDGEGAQAGAFWVLAGDGHPAVVVGTGLVDDHGLTVAWDNTAAACEPRPSDGCTDTVRNVPLAASIDGHSASVWQGAVASLGAGTFRVTYAQQPVGESHCDDATGIGLNWVYGPGI